MSDEMEVEGQKILTKAGKGGRFQLISSVFIIGYSFIMFYNVTSLPLQKIRPEAICRNKDDISDDFIPCTQDSYCDPNYEKIILKEKSLNNWYLDFEVDCDTEKNFDFIISSIFIGGFLSYIFLSKWADIIGRKLVLQFEIYGLLTIVIISIFANNLYIIAGLWFLYEFCNHVYSLLHIYTSEIASQEYFSFICSLSNICFPLTGLINSLLFFSLRDWRLVHLIFTVIAVISAIVFKMTLIETPPYSLKIKDTKTFVESVKKIALYNGTLELVNNDLESFEKNFSYLRKSLNKLNKKEDLLLEEHKLLYNSNVTLYDMFMNDTNFRKEYLIIIYCYAMCNFIFFGVLLNIEKYDDNVFLFSIILYSSEMTAEFLSGIMAQKYGRVVVIKYNFYLCCVSFIFFNFLNNIKIFRFFFCFTGNFGISASFNVMAIYLAEVFDISIKSQATSTVRIPTQFVVIFSPYIVSRMPSPFILFGVLSGLAGYFIQYCKETLEEETYENYRKNSSHSGFFPH